MANKFFPKGAEKILSGAIDFSSGDVTAALVSSGYTFDGDDEFIADLSGVILGTPKTLVNPSVAGGVFNADTVEFGIVSAGSIAQAVVLYNDTGNTSTSQLIAYLDVISGFPAATNGGEIDVKWSSGSAKIVSLV